MQIIHVLHKLTLSTSKMTEGAKENVHWCKKTALYFILIVALRERDQAQSKLFSKIF